MAFAFDPSARMLFNYFPFGVTSDGWFVLGSLSAAFATSSIVFTQSRPSTDFWSPISSIVFGTTLPVRPVDSGTPALLGTSDFSPSASQNFLQVATDISLPLEGGASDYLGMIS